MGTSLNLSFALCDQRGSKAKILVVTPQQKICLNFTNFTTAQCQIRKNPQNSSKSNLSQTKLYIFFVVDEKFC